MNPSNNKCFSYFVSVGEQYESVMIPITNYLTARYCISPLRRMDSLVSDPLDQVLAIKTGLCLPDGCDSLDYRDKFQLTKQLNDHDRGVAARSRA